jgi:hypothetical protein
MRSQWLSIYDPDGVFMIIYVTYYFGFEVPFPARWTTKFERLCSVLECYVMLVINLEVNWAGIHTSGLCNVDIIQDCHGIFVY